MLYFDHPACLEHDPGVGIPGHPEAPQRLLAIERELAGRDWLGAERRPAPAAGEAELRLIHSARHVEAIRELSRRGGGAIDADTFAGEHSYRAALHAAGGACALTRALLAGEDASGFAAVRPAGHHAEAERAMGFCLFNGVAVAAALAIAELGASRVFILDWDVHHGNGTAAAFRDRDDVLLVSIHQAGIYPGSGAPGEVGAGAGEGYTINLPVPAGSGEELWLSLLDRVAIPVALAFEPDLILVSAGFDAHLLDPLAGCELQARSFARMASRVAAAARRLGVPVGAVLEGGYHPAALAESVAATVAALGGEPRPEPEAPHTPLSSRLASGLAPYWEL